MKVDILMTVKEPEKESAMIAPMTGNKRVEPLTTFPILAAVMLLMLNSLIRYTIRFANHPPLASCVNVTVPETETKHQYKIVWKRERQLKYQ